MPKSKKGGNGKKDTKTTDGAESGTGSDPTVLFRNYTKCCESIGITIDENVKKALTQNSDNPNASTQLILLGANPKVDDGAENDDGEESSPPPMLGPGGCRALVSAILGECNDSNIAKYLGFRDMRILRSNIGDNGATALARLLSKCDGREDNPKLEYLELPDNKIGVMGALAIGRSLCCGVSI